MGEVWRAYDTRLDREVAIKFLSSGVIEGADRARFAREAKVAAQLTHPNIVAIYDAGDWDDRPYIVLELVTGTTLAQELAAGEPMPVERAVDAVAQVAQGLAAAHAVGVIHRDIKPGNLIRAADGRIKILDFGIARLLDERSTRLTRPGLVIGTAAYSAPEQISAGSADARSDLYALGCVLYELLTGRPPFEGDLAAVAYGHVHRTPAPASELRPGLPPELGSLLTVLLAKDPAARPGSAAEVGEWLRQPTISQELPAMPPPLPIGPPPLPVNTAGTTTPIAPVPPPAGAGPQTRTSVWGQEQGGPYGADPYGADHAERQDRARARRGRRWWFGLVAASAVLAVVVGLVGSLARGLGGSLDDGAGDEPIAESNQPQEDQGDQSGSSGPSWARDLEREMDRLRDAGRIGSDTAEDIREKIDKAVQDNRPEKARQELEKLQEKLDRRADEWQQRSDEWRDRADQWDKTAEEWSSELLEDLPVVP